MNERYRRFIPHEDNVGEIISAEHINELQRQAEANQRELFRQADVDFLDRCLFVLEHHPYVNAMYIDLLEDTTKLNLDQSAGIVFSEPERAVALADSVVSGTLLTKVYQNPNNTTIRDVLLVVDAYVPEGSSIRYELSNNGIDFYTVLPGTSNVFTFPTAGSQLVLRAELMRPLNGESPLIKGIAILYRDPKYVVELLDNMPSFGDGGEWDFVFRPLSHKDLIDVGPDDHHPREHRHDGTDGSGLISHKHLLDIGPDDHHPKNHRHGQDGVDPVHLETDVVGTLGLEHLPIALFTGVPGEMELVYNPEAEDRLVKVVAPDQTVYLFYDWENEGQLSRAITVRGDVAVIVDLTYGTYVNSEGQEETVLLSRMSRVVDAKDAEVQEWIARVMEPAPKEA